MSTYTIDMSGRSCERGSLGADQTAPGGVFTSTDFDKAKVAFLRYIESGQTKFQSATIKAYVVKNAVRFMIAYRSIAMQLGKPYVQADLSTWSAKLPSYGLEYGQLFLSAYRRAHDAGLIPDSVYNPKKYLEDHPEQKPDPRSWYQQLIDSLGKKVGTAAKWTGLAVAAYFILPKLIVTGARVYRERKGATA